jgi:uncharacterized CHY-type Zn-finger protein
VLVMEVIRQIYFTKDWSLKVDSLTVRIAKETRPHHLHHRHDAVPADTTSSPPSQARCCPCRYDLITSITSTMLSLLTGPHHLHDRHDVVRVDTTSSPQSQARCFPCRHDLILSITGTMLSLQTRPHHLHPRHDVVPVDTTSSPVMMSCLQGQHLACDGGDEVVSTWTTSCL